MTKPLQEKRIVVTRSVAQAPPFSTLLESYGAIPVLIPSIQFLALPSPSLEKALLSLGEYDWLLFTSVNAVHFFFQQVDAVGLKPTWPALAVSGSATATALQERGLEPDFVPDEFVGEVLVLGLGDVQGKRILLPRSRIGRPEIVEMLRERGADVDDIGLYDTVPAQPDSQSLDELHRGIDAITFTSPSGVRNFLKIIEDMPDLRSQIKHAIVACIGPITAEAALKAGLHVTVVPAEYTIDGLVEALVAYYARQTAITDYA